MEVSNAVETLHGVGPYLATKLGQLGIQTIRDLLENYPRRYNDYSELISIKDLRPGIVSVLGSFKQVKGRYLRRGLHITEAVFSDATGSVRVIWFNQPYRSNSIKNDEKYFVSGTFELSHQRLQITNPAVEPYSQFPAHTARIIPVYRESKTVSSSQIRKLIKTAIQSNVQYPSVLPAEIIKSYKLSALKKAVSQIHFPTSMQDVAEAKYRLGFEEIYELILAHLLLRKQTENEHAIPIPFKKKIATNLVDSLPFKLTGAQKIAVWQSYQDMEKSSPMNRLIEGDVGSGKTVVAAMLAAMTMQQSLQVALMAPTEILARQHAETMQQILRPLKLADSVLLITGSMSIKQKNLAKEKIIDGTAKLIIGTHTLIQESVDMHKLALVIIDEQHRFGVEQRKKLLQKAGHMPHMLSMTATPIPRSLALTVYGDLDVSVLDQKPPGRKHTITELVQTNHRLYQYKKIETDINKGRQAFVVCPLIDDSISMQSKTAVSVQKELVKLLPNCSVGLLHGKLSSDKKQQIMQDFIDKKYDILVSTTVIEVGVDVPNATIMCIEAPERFGLAQIHQLRGRVGRGAHQSYCYLMLSNDNVPSRRLRAVAQSNDGFKLAELDLEIRGPGAIYGTLQHGLLDLRMVNLTDTKLIARARKAALDTVKKDPSLLQYPQLKARVESLQKIVHLN